MTDDNMRQNKPFRVLCLDGGGMRGLYTASLLDTLAKRFNSGKPMDIGAQFDLIVGTSTGGLLAVGLAYGLSTEDIVGLYRDNGPQIFQNPAPKVKGKRQWLNWLIKRKASAKKGQLALRSALRKRFGDMTVVQLFKNRSIAICIPTVRMESRKAWVFKTPHLAGKDRDNNYKLVDVCLATSAAPLLLPLVPVERPDAPNEYDTFTDGGLWANNPIMIGLIEALEVAPKYQKIEIVSIGTAEPPAGATISRTDMNWGVGGSHWMAGVGIVETALDAQVSGAAFMATKILPYLKHSVEITRLPHTPPSADQVRHVAIDRAYDLAVKALTDMGKSDAEIIHSKTMAGLTEYKTIKEIFMSARDMQIQTDPCAA